MRSGTRRFQRRKQQNGLACNVETLAAGDEQPQVRRQREKPKRHLRDRIAEMFRIIKDQQERAAPIEDADKLFLSRGVGLGGDSKRPQNRIVQSSGIRQGNQGNKDAFTLPRSGDFRHQPRFCPCRPCR